jgi:hypothetical protein
MAICGMRGPLLLLALALLAPIASIAHQVQVALTTVTFSVRTGSVEVIHRFYTHDTEHAMSILAGRQADIMLDQAVQQQFGQYVSKYFQLLDQNGKELPLALVGVELEGDVIWVYQETPLPGHLTELSVTNPVLLDLLPGQVNTVNVECGGELSTLEFSGNSRAARAAINFSACLPQK